MIEKDKAILVDIRYPGRFRGVAIDERDQPQPPPMPTEVMNEHIAKLPKRPIIMPCYDRRGCFFGEVLGYELTKAGHDLRGRYTAAVGVLRRPRRARHMSKEWLADNNKGCVPEVR